MHSTQFARLLPALAVFFPLARAADLSSAERGTGQSPGDPSSPAAEEESRAEFGKWLEGSALSVERWEMNAELEAYLDRALEGKRIVFIGEPGHFYDEKYDVQLLLIRHLASRGYGHIFQEGLGASTAPAFDEFVRTGTRPGEGVESGAGEDLVRYRDRAFAGWEGTKNPEFGKRVSSARVRFFEQIHAISSALPEGRAPLQVHALDIDMLPGGCYHSLARLLREHADVSELDSVRDLLGKVEGESVEQELARLELLSDLVQEDPEGLLAALEPDVHRELCKFTDCLVESLAFLNTARSDGKLDRALVRREPAMFRQVQHVLEGLPPDAKVIMLAHTNHLSKVGADTLRARRPSVGEMIDRTYPGQVFSIWMLHDRGELLNPMNPELFERLESDPERVESLMAAAGSTYVLPLGTGAVGESYLATKRNYSYFTWSETGTLTLQTDAIFFLDTVTPLSE